MPARDPDASLVAVFKNMAIQNPAKTAEAGRPIFDDREVVEIRAPGSRNFSVHPANVMSHWQDDPETGEQTPVTYAERFRHQYVQFKAHGVQTKTGTPLTHAPFLTEGRRAELRAQNIYTVEALADLDGEPLKNLGYGGRDMKNQAMEYIEEARRGAVDSKLAADLEAIKARNAILEEDIRFMKAQVKTDAGKDDTFEGMSIEQLRDYITANTGKGPVGQPSKSTLVRMAREATPDRVA